MLIFRPLTFKTVWHKFPISSNMLKELANCRSYMKMTTFNVISICPKWLLKQFLAIAELYKEVLVSWIKVLRIRGWHTTVQPGESMPSSLQISLLQNGRQEIFKFEVKPWKGNKNHKAIEKTDSIIPVAGNRTTTRPQPSNCLGLGKDLFKEKSWT